MQTDWTMTRADAIGFLRIKCSELVDDEHSLCEVASKLGILCGGFSQWTTDELKRRFDWIVRKRPKMTRAELEGLANRWELARQFVRGEELACDIQSADEPHRICEGWDGLDDRTLERWVFELTGNEVQIVEPQIAEG